MGRREERMEKALIVLSEAGPDGITARELAKMMMGNDVSGVNNWGSPLTLLRQEGEIYALTEKREGHHVYVLPRFLQDRPAWSGFRHHCAGCTCNREED